MCTQRNPHNWSSALHKRFQEVRRHHHPQKKKKKKKKKKHITIIAIWMPPLWSNHRNTITTYGRGPEGQQQGAVWGIRCALVDWKAESSVLIMTFRLLFLLLFLLLLLLLPLARRPAFLAVVGLSLCCCAGAALAGGGACASRAMGQRLLRTLTAEGGGVCMGAVPGTAPRVPEAFPLPRTSIDGLTD
jgi:hypothetical protein